MKETNQDFVKVVDFYNRLSTQEKLKFQKLVTERIKKLAERDAQND